MEYESRKYDKFRFSPEGRRRRTEEVQGAIAAIIAGAHARPKLSSDDIRRLAEGFPAGHLMIEARRLAKNMAKTELQRRAIRIHEVNASDINEIVHTLWETDVIIKTAKANLEKRNPGNRYA